MGWHEEFRAETGRVIREPFLLCLAEAVATVESAGGQRAIVEQNGLNEIGYKAVPGRPSTDRMTREAGPDNDGTTGEPKPTRARFRLFADRQEQAEALLWLMRSSVYYEAARLLYLLAFYSAYAPGRTDGLRELLRVFDALARAGAHPGVRPFELTDPAKANSDGRALNHAAARQAVRLFGEWTRPDRMESGEEEGADHG
jgi:hypothetical protein